MGKYRISNENLWGLEIYILEEINRYDFNPLDPPYLYLDMVYYPVVSRFLSQNSHLTFWIFLLSKFCHDVL